jgi:hypothetical protein
VVMDCAKTSTTMKKPGCFGVTSTYRNEKEFTFLASASTVKEARSFWFYVHAQKQRFTFLASNRQTHAANHH